MPHPCVSDVVTSFALKKLPPFIVERLFKTEHDMDEQKRKETQVATVYG